MEDLRQIVEKTSLDTEQISSLTAEIHAQVLKESQYLDAPNFTSTHPDDLEPLFDHYAAGSSTGRSGVRSGTFRCTSLFPSG